MVVWIFAIATIALLVVIIQLMLLYQRRFNEIRIRQDPVRRRIENHYSEMENGCNRIEDAVVSGQEEIGLAIDHLHKQRDALTQAMSQLQAQADSADPPSESEGDEWMLEVAVASEPDPFNERGYGPTRSWTVAWTNATEHPSRGSEITSSPKPV